MKDKFTLITGGSEGIGFELAKLFANDNNNILLVARNNDKLNEAKEYLKKNYDVNVITISLDLSVDNSCEKLFEFVEENNLIVDNLINNAGIGSFGFFHAHWTLLYVQWTHRHVPMLRACHAAFCTTPHIRESRQAEYRCAKHLGSE